MLDVAEVQPPGVDRFPVRRPIPRAQLDTLSREILALKNKLNAVILAHNYQVPEIQVLADYVGDSLGLSQQAARTNADVIVFCGVHFMAETAKILNPNKIVVLPDKDAGCSLEESCPADKLKAFQATTPSSRSPSACSPMKYARPRRWLLFADARRRGRLSLRPRRACCTGSRRNVPTRSSSPRRRRIAAATNAGS